MRTRHLVPLCLLLCLGGAAPAAAATQEGALVRAFGGNGRVFTSSTTSVGRPTSATWVRILPAANRRIIAVGTATFGTGPGADSRVVIARFSDTGELDSTFAGGRALFGTPGSATTDAADAVQLPGGDIVVAATSRFDPRNPGDDRMVMLRVRTGAGQAGTLDALFGDRGFVVAPNAEPDHTAFADQAVGLAVSGGGGRLYLAGARRHQDRDGWRIGIYDFRGQPVQREGYAGGGSFGGGTSVAGDGALPGGIAPYRDGLMMSMASTNGRALGAVALDREAFADHRTGTFGNGDGFGHRIADFGGTEAIAGRPALDPAQTRVLVPGGIRIGGGESRTAIAAFKAGGGLDRSFSGDGRLVIDLPGGMDRGTDALVLPNNRIVIASTTPNATALIRLHPNGELDRSFGGDGIVLDRPAESSRLQSVTVARVSNDVIAGGLEVSRSGERRFALSRFGEAVPAYTSCTTIIGCTVATPVARTADSTPRLRFSVEPTCGKSCRFAFGLEVFRLSGARRISIGTTSLGSVRGPGELNWDLKLSGRLLEAGRYEVRLRALDGHRVLQRSRGLRLILRREKYGITPIPIP